MIYRLVVISMLGALVAACETSDGGSVTQYPTNTAPAYGTADDIANFQGARAGQAEMGLNNMGYTLARTEGLTAFWWNESTQTCARIVTSDGRYQSVSTASPGECGR